MFGVFKEETNMFPLASKTILCGLLITWLVGGGVIELRVIVALGEPTLVRALPLYSVRKPGLVWVTLGFQSAEPCGVGVGVA